MIPGTAHIDFGSLPDDTLCDYRVSMLFSDGDHERIVYTRTKKDRNLLISQLPKAGCPWILERGGAFGFPLVLKEVQVVAWVFETDFLINRASAIRMKEVGGL